MKWKKMAANEGKKTGYFKEVKLLWWQRHKGTMFTVCRFICDWSPLCLWRCRFWGAFSVAVSTYYRPWIELNQIDWQFLAFQRFRYSISKTLAQWHWNDQLLCVSDKSEQVGRSWQLSGERKKMLSILSSGAYWLTHYKKRYVFARTLSLDKSSCI